MCVNERDPRGCVRLQGEAIKKVEDFKYLGKSLELLLHYIDNEVARAPVSKAPDHLLDLYLERCVRHAPPGEGDPQNSPKRAGGIV